MFNNVSYNDDLTVCLHACAMWVSRIGTWAYIWMVVPLLIH